MSVQSKLNRGVLTIATGDRSFVEMAVDMALSYQLFNPEPVSCIVDAATKDFIETNYNSVFDQLILLPEAYNVGRTRKFSCAALSPYQSTMFVDSDILFLNGIQKLWEAGEKVDNVTLIGDYLDADSNMIHHGFTIPELLLQDGIPRYLKCNSGFFHFNPHKSKAFFEACSKKYKLLMDSKEFVRGRWLGDEIALGMVADQFGVECFPLPSPMMWDAQLAKLKKNESRYPICHFIAPIPAGTVKWLVSRAGKLRKKKKLPTGGEEVWLDLNKKRMNSRKGKGFVGIKSLIIGKLRRFLKA